MHHPALVTHAFFPADAVINEASSVAATAVETITKRAIGEKYDAAIPDWPEEYAAPTATDESGLLVRLFGAARPGAGRVRVLLIYQINEVIGVSTIDAYQSVQPSWPEFDKGWTEPVRTILESAQPSENLIGWAEVYSARVGGRFGTIRGLARPLAPDHARIQPEASWRPESGLLVSELDREHAQERRLFAMGRTDDVLDRWLWTSPSAALPLLTRYLLQSAQLRYQRAELLRKRPEYTGAIDKIDKICEDLRAALQGQEIPHAQILLANQALIGLTTEQGGVVTHLTDVRSRIGTVEAVVHNLRTVGAGGRVGAADQPYGDRLLVQLRTEEAYLAAAQLKAAELSRLAGSTVNSRLEDRKAELTLVMSSLLGAILMALGAVQSLQYRVPLPARVQPPTIAVLAALALALPLTVLRLSSSADQRSGPGWDYSLATAIGGTGGWLAMSVISFCTDREFQHWQSHAWVTLCAATAAIVAAIGAAYLIRRARPGRKVQATMRSDPGG
ncbi:hypothetical protein Adu01nite_48060 [Paractinoplanes durhamensis]|uniref:Uncharacterized protein n=1 Tax=Paractinoplanes durhamensis TaxID=113563 RepID=A0ABQ3Z0W5_9ACTN|nr:hypothetical protein Adu01nite_48060 [Actinoplanes durhamensis]